MSEPLASRNRLGYSLGSVRFEHGLSLAPMAGNTNLAYRRMCRDFGAELTTTEMVSAMALRHGDDKTLNYLERDEETSPDAAQVFGADPEVLAEAAQKIVERGFDVVDLNIGCPVPKITGGGGGSALLQTPDQAAACIAAMSAAVDVPVTVKIRAGWSDDNKNAPEFARCMEQAGAQAITVHGRTREQKYTGRADLDLIQRVVEAVSIPVIGNGDVVDLESGKRMAETGVAGIAIGRGALGRPWLFGQLHALFRGEEVPEAPNMSTRSALLLSLGRGVCELYGEHRGMRIMRRLATDFFRGLRGAPAMRKDSNTLTCLADLETLATRIAVQDDSHPDQQDPDA
jgi:tRNA-dihydrouridine synthase B